MLKENKLLILVNSILVALYLSFNWLEYNFLSEVYLNNLPIIKTYFPLYFTLQTSSALRGIGAIYLHCIPNFSLLIFLVAIVANSYFFSKLARTKVSNP